MQCRGGDGVRVVLVWCGDIWSNQWPLAWLSSSRSPGHQGSPTVSHEGPSCSARGGWRSLWNERGLSCDCLHPLSKDCPNVGLGVEVGGAGCRVGEGEKVGLGREWRWVGQDMGLERERRWSWGWRIGGRVGYGGVGGGRVREEVVGYEGAECRWVGLGCGMVRRWVGLERGRR